MGASALSAHREAQRYAIILASINGADRLDFTFGKIEREPPNLVASLAGLRRLREENARLRSLLVEHGLYIPETPPTTGMSRTTSTPSAADQSALGTAEQRIALFRSLFRGRDYVYAIRWESADGRSGYMPKADRDWKSYLRGKGEERKKVDRLTRHFRPLTDDVVRVQEAVLREKLSERLLGSKGRYDAKEAGTLGGSPHGCTEAEART
jgi:hypothetical protein